MSSEAASEDAEPSRMPRIAEWMEQPDSESDAFRRRIDRLLLIQMGRHRIRRFLLADENFINFTTTTRHNFNNTNRPSAAASKASIDAMPRVTVTNEGAECSICLQDLEVGAEAREMPCKHRFHSLCIEAWLGRRGFCPLCRFSMPKEQSVLNLN